MLALSCARSAGLEPLEAPVFQVVSPSPDSRVRASWVPLVVRLSEPFAEAEVRVLLDGQPVDGELVVRPRGPNLGGGLDLIGWLDLSELQPGERELLLELRSPEGRELRQTQHFTWDRPEHRVRLSAEAARVFVEHEGQPLHLYTADPVDPRGRDADLHSVFVVGEASVWLDEGDYRFTCSRGLRYGLEVHEVELRGELELRCEPQLQVPTPGWSSADFHVHTARSGDSFVPDALRWASLRAADLDLVVLSDHDLIQPAPGPGRLPGVEATIYQEAPQSPSGWRSISHVNAFPVEGELEEGRRPFEEVVAAYQARGAVVQLNHPRGIQFRTGHEPARRAHALFNQRGFEPEQVLGVDAIELVNRASWPLYLEVRQDWFALLEAGQRITGTGNSDSHALAVENAGAPINLVPCEVEDTPCVVRAVQEGRVRVSTGPIVDVQVEGDVLRLRVEAADHVPVREARLVADGEVVWRADVEQLPAEFELPLPEAQWVLAEAGWPLDEEPRDFGVYSQLYPGMVPLGFTNPLWLD